MAVPISLATTPSDAFSKSTFKINVDTVAALEALSDHREPFPSGHVPRTIDELMRLRSFEYPNEPILAYPLHDTDYVEYSYSDLDIFAFRVAQRYGRAILQRRSSDEKEKVVALLGPSNFDYLITVLALSKLGFTVLFLSTRLSDAAYLSLIESTECKDLLTHPSFDKTGIALRASMPDINIHRIAQMSDYGDPIQNIGQNTRLDFHLRLSEESQKICWIIHSSGSTGLPKPILQTHRAALNNYANNLNMRGFVTLPLFHAHGISSVFRAFTSVKIIHMYNASLPLTRNHLLNIMDEYNFEILYGVPYALKLLGETREGIEALAKLKVVMFGGSACPDSLGDRLVHAGVNLISHYGTTETGQLMTSFRVCNDKAWNYLRPSPQLMPYLRWEPRGMNRFELVVLEGWPSKVATNRPDGAYATKDLFTPHPTIPQAWRYSARLDDAIALLNGEKANPSDMEQAVRDNKNVTEAVVFGEGKPQLGMIIIPSEQTVGLPEQEVLERLWPTIQTCNKSAPGYAKISLEMIKLLPVNTIYPRTDKGTAIRQTFYKLFEKEIEEVYTTSDAASSNPPSTEGEIRSFLREYLCSMFGTENISDKTDIFSLGLDSLQALRFRAEILKRLPISGSALAMNVVFDFPSIEDLTQELLSLQKGLTTQATPIEEQMAEMIDKYGTFPKEEYVVLTGATGSLGAHLIAKLVLLPNVRTVYCLVRATSQENARQRVKSSLRSRAVYHRLSLQARRKIVSIPSNFSEPDLGLGSAYTEISQQITCLIHCAWSVNFNLSFRSFEKDCIAGVRNLITLCLAAGRLIPASFNFCSSVSAVAATPNAHSIPEELPMSLSYAQNMGYAQSKHVAEHLVHRAATQTGMKARTLRIGQIVADTEHGIWNATEAIPLMLQAGKTIGSIPALDESPLWLPVDTVAQTVIDHSLSDSAAGTINVVAPKPFHWTRDLLPLLHASGLKFEEVGQKEWVKRLRASNPNPLQNPPIKLLEFFAKKYDNDTSLRQSLSYDTEKAQSLSPTLAAADVLNQEFVTKFVNNFLASSWRSAQEQDTSATKTLVVVAGPCGAGKSTIGTALAKKFNCDFIEGDEYHDEAALSKMVAGTPLDDEDRWPWLKKLRSLASKTVADSSKSTIVLSCSALKQSYRDLLREGAADLKTVFVMLQVDTKEELERRLDTRSGHYMKAALVDSQIGSLEGPALEETDIIPFDATGSPEDIVFEIVQTLQLGTCL